MARPRRTTEESFYDLFSDFDVDDQAVALRILEQIHRLAKRDRRNKSEFGDERVDSVGSAHVGQTAPMEAFRRRHA